jgi:hypothetical protein
MNFPFIQISQSIGLQPRTPEQAGAARAAGAVYDCACSDLARGLRNLAISFVFVLTASAWDITLTVSLSGWLARPASLAGLVALRTPAHWLRAACGCT